MELSSATKVWVRERSHFSGVNVAKRAEELHVLNGGCIWVMGFHAHRTPETCESARRARWLGRPPDAGRLVRVGWLGDLEPLAEQILRALSGLDVKALQTCDACARSSMDNASKFRSED